MKFDNPHGNGTLMDKEGKKVFEGRFVCGMRWDGVGKFEFEDFLFEGEIKCGLITKGKEFDLKSSNLLWVKKHIYYWYFLFNNFFDRKDNI